MSFSDGVKNNFIERKEYLEELKLFSIKEGLFNGYVIEKNNQLKHVNIFQLIYEKLFGEASSQQSFNSAVKKYILKIEDYIQDDDIGLVMALANKAGIVSSSIDLKKEIPTIDPDNLSLDELICKICKKHLKKDEIKNNQLFQEKQLFFDQKNTKIIESSQITEKILDIIIPEENPKKKDPILPDSSASEVHEEPFNLPSNVPIVNSEEFQETEKELPPEEKDAQDHQFQESQLTDPQFELEENKIINQEPQQAEYEPLPEHQEDTNAGTQEDTNYQEDANYSADNQLSQDNQLADQQAGAENEVFQAEVFEDVAPEESSQVQNDEPPQILQEIPEPKNPHEEISKPTIQKEAVFTSQDQNVSPLKTYHTHEELLDAVIGQSLFGYFDSEVPPVQICYERLMKVPYDVNHNEVKPVNPFEQAIFELLIAVQNNDLESFKKAFIGENPYNRLAILSNAYQLADITNSNEIKNEIMDLIRELDLGAFSEIDLDGLSWDIKKEPDGKSYAHYKELTGVDFNQDYANEVDEWVFDIFSTIEQADDLELFELLKYIEHANPKNTQALLIQALAMSKELQAQDSLNGKRHLIDESLLNQLGKNNSQSISKYDPKIEDHLLAYLKAQEKIKERERTNKKIAILMGVSLAIAGGYLAANNMEAASRVEESQSPIPDPFQGLPAKPSLFKGVSKFDRSEGLPNRPGPFIGESKLDPFQDLPAKPSLFKGVSKFDPSSGLPAKPGLFIGETKLDPFQGLPARPGLFKGVSKFDSFKDLAVKARPNFYTDSHFRVIPTVGPPNHLTEVIVPAIKTVAGGIFALGVGLVAWAWGGKKETVADVQSIDAAAVEPANDLLVNGSDQKSGQAEVDLTVSHLLSEPPIGDIPPDNEEQISQESESDIKLNDSKVEAGHADIEKPIEIKLDRNLKKFENKEPIDEPIVTFRPSATDLGSKIVNPADEEIESSISQITDNQKLFESEIKTPRISDEELERPQDSEKEFSSLASPREMKDEPVTKESLTTPIKQSALFDAAEARSEKILDKILNDESISEAIMFPPYINKVATSEEKDLVLKLLEDLLTIEAKDGSKITNYVLDKHLQNILIKAFERPENEDICNRLVDIAQSKVGDQLEEKYRQLHDMQLYLVLLNSHVQSSKKILNEEKTTLTKLVKAVQENISAFSEFLTPGWRHHLYQIETIIKEKLPKKDQGFQLSELTSDVKQRIKIDDRTFASILLESMIKGSSTLEGNSTAQVVLYLKNYLEANQTKYAQILEFPSILKMFRDADKHLASQGGVTRVNNNQEFQPILERYQRVITETIRDLKPGEKTLIPIGWTGSEVGHAMEMGVEREKNNSLRVVIYNTGSGINEYHPSIIQNGELLFQTFIELVDVQQERLLDDEFLQALLEMNLFTKVYKGQETKYGPSDVYETILNSLGGEIAPWHSDREKFTPPQFSGTCTWSSLLAVLYKNLPKKDYYTIASDIALDAVCSYYQSMKDQLEKNDESRHMLEHASVTCAQLALEGYANGGVSIDRLNVIHDTLKELQNSLEVFESKRHYLKAPQGLVAFENFEPIEPNAITATPLQLLSSQIAQGPTRIFVNRPTAHKVFSFDWLKEPKNIQIGLAEFLRHLNESDDIERSRCLEGFFRLQAKGKIDNEIWKKIPEEMIPQVTELIATLSEEVIKASSILKQNRRQYATYALYLSAVSLMLSERSSNPAIQRYVKENGVEYLNYKNQIESFVGKPKKTINTGLNLYHPEDRALQRKALDILESQKSKAKHLYILSKDPLEDFSTVKSYSTCEMRFINDYLVENPDAGKRLVQEFPPTFEYEDRMGHNVPLSLCDWYGKVLPKDFCALRRIAATTDLMIGEYVGSKDFIFKSEIQQADGAFFVKNDFGSSERNFSTDVSESIQHELEDVFSKQANRMFDTERKILNDTKRKLKGLKPQNRAELRMIRSEKRRGELGLVLALRDSNGDESYIEQQVTKTLSYFSSHLTEMDKHDNRMLCRFLLFERQYLENMLESNPAFSQVLNEFIKNGYHHFINEKNLSAACFFIEMGRELTAILNFKGYEHHFPNFRDLSIKLLSRADLTLEERTLIYQQIAASYESDPPSYEDFTKDDATLLLKAVIADHSLSTNDNETILHLLDQIKKATWRWEEKIEKFLKGEEGSEICNAVIKEFEPYAIGESWDFSKYPLCQSKSGGFYIHAKDFTFYNKGKTICSLPRDVLHNHDFYELFSHRNYIATKTGLNSYEFVDKRGNPTKIDLPEVKVSENILIRQKFDGHWYELAKKKNLPNFPETIQSLCNSSFVWIPCDSQTNSKILLKNKDCQTTHSIPFTDPSSTSTDLKDNPFNPVLSFIPELPTEKDVNAIYAFLIEPQQDKEKEIVRKTCLFKLNFYHKIQAYYQDIFKNLPMQSDKLFNLRKGVFKENQISYPPEIEQIEDVDAQLDAMNAFDKLQKQIKAEEAAIFENFMQKEHENELFRHIQAMFLHITPGNKSSAYTSLKQQNKINFFPEPDSDAPNITLGICCKEDSENSPLYLVDVANGKNLALKMLNGRLWKDKDGILKELELPALDLTFEVRKEKTVYRAYSKEHSDYFIATNQNYNGLEAIPNALVLENKEGKRKLLMPYGKIKPLAKGSFASQLKVVNDVNPVSISIDLNKFSYPILKNKEQQLYLAGLLLAQKKYDQAQSLIRSSFSEVVPYNPKEIQLLIEIATIPLTGSDNSPHAAAIACTAISFLTSLKGSINQKITGNDLRAIANGFLSYKNQMSVVPHLKLTKNEEIKSLNYLITNLSEFSDFESIALVRKLKSFLNIPENSYAIQSSFSKKIMEQNPKSGMLLYSALYPKVSVRVSSPERLLTRPGESFLKDFYKLYELAKTDPLKLELHLSAAAQQGIKDVPSEIITLLRSMSYAFNHDIDEVYDGFPPELEDLKRCIEMLGEPKTQEEGQKIFSKLLSDAEKIKNRMEKEKSAHKPIDLTGFAVFYPRPENAQTLSFKENVSSPIELSKIPERKAILKSAQLDAVEVVPSTESSESIEPQTSPSPLEPSQLPGTISAQLDADKAMPSHEAPKPQPTQGFFEKKENLALHLDSNEISELQNVFLRSRNTRDSAVAAKRAKHIEAYWTKPEHATSWHAIDSERIPKFKTLLLVEQAEMGKQLALQEKKLLEFANTLPNEIRILLETEMIGNIRQPITLREIMIFTARSAHFTLAGKNPELLLREKELLEKSILYFDVKAQMQQLGRAIGVLDELSSCDKTNTIESGRLSEACYQELTRKPPYDAHEHPELLIFEVVEDIGIHDWQISDLKRMLRPKPGENSNIVLQKVMGAGKTKVYLPILALSKADGEHIPFVVVHSSQFDTVAPAMQINSGQNFAQVAHTLTFSRESDTSLEALNKILDEVKLVQKQRHFFVVTDKSLHSLSLAFSLLWDEYLDSEYEDRSLKERIEVMRTILNLIQNKGKAVLDEADLLLNNRFEVVYSLGEPKPIKSEHADLVADIFRCIDPHLSSLVPFTKADYLSKKPELIKSFMPVILEKMPSYDHNLIFKYLSGDPEGDKYVDTLPKKDRNLLAIAFYQFDELLSIVLDRRCNEHYGYSDHPDKILPVPYVASGVPSPTAEFSFPYVLLGYVMQTLKNDGVTPMRFKQIIEDLQEQVLKEQKADTSIPLGQTEGYKSFCELWGKDAKSMDSSVSFFKVNDADIAKLVKLYKENPPDIYGFAKKYLFPAVKIHPRKLTSTPYTLRNMFLEMQGFTGTPFNHMTFPKDMETIFDSNSAGKTEGIIWKNSQTVHSLKDTGFQNVINGISQIQQKGDFHAFIDTGALFNGEDNRKVAEALLKTLPANINSVLFFKDNRACILDRKNALSYFQEGQSTKDIYLYYDQWHTTGTNFKIAGKSLMSIGKNKMRDVEQGYMRDRQAAQGNRVEFIISKESDEYMKKELDLSANKKITTGDILSFAESNQVSEIEQLIMMGSFGQVKEKANHILLSVLLDPNISPQTIREKKDTVQNLIGDKVKDSPHKDFGQHKHDVDADKFFESFVDKAVHKVEPLIADSELCPEGITTKKLTDQLRDCIDLKLFPKKISSKSNHATNQEQENLAEQERMTETEKENITDLSLAHMSEPPRLDFSPGLAAYSRSCYRVVERSKVKNQIDGCFLKISDIFQGDQSLKEFSDVFDIETSYNFLPVEVNKGTPSKPFGQAELPVKNILICKDRKSGQVQVRLLSQADASFFYKHMAQRSPYESTREVDATLYHLSLKVYQSTDMEIATFKKDVLNEPGVVGKVVQAKFFNGEITYSPEEKVYLEIWVKEKGPERMERLFTKHILALKENKKAAYQGSWLAKLFENTKKR